MTATPSPIESGAQRLQQLTVENAALREMLGRLGPSTPLWDHGHDFAQTKYRGFDLVVELRPKGKPEHPWRVWCAGRLLRAGVGSSAEAAGKLATGWVDSVLAGKETDEYTATKEAELRRYGDRVAELIGALETAAKRGEPDAITAAVTDLFTAFGVEVRR